MINKRRANNLMNNFLKVTDQEYQEQVEEKFKKAELIPKTSSRTSEGTLSRLSRRGNISFLLNLKRMERNILTSYPK